MDQPFWVLVSRQYINLCTPTPLTQQLNEDPVSLSNMTTETNLVFTLLYAPTNVKPLGGGRGYPQEIDSARFSLGGDFDIRVLPWGREFDIATTCFGQTAVPRGGNLTFSRCPGVGNLTLALAKMSNSLASSPTLGLNIDWCINPNN